MAFVRQRNKSELIWKLDYYKRLCAETPDMSNRMTLQCANAFEAAGRFHSGSAEVDFNLGPSNNNDCVWPQIAFAELVQTKLEHAAMAAKTSLVHRCCVHLEQSEKSSSAGDIERVLDIRLTDSWWREEWRKHVPRLGQIKKNCFLS